MAYLIDPGRSSYLLDDLAAEYGVELVPEPAADEETAALVRHAAATLRLEPQLPARIAERGLDPLYRNVELPLSAVLAAMEDVGVRIDTYRMGEITARLAERVEELEARAHELAGEEFMLGSTQQVARILFEVLGLTAGRKGKTGYSTDARVLRSIRDEHEIVGVIEEWREYSKLLNTYLEPLPSLISPEDGRLHTHFNQAVASTGRLSTSNPNLQAIPIRTELGREIRSAFVAEPGFRLLSADYSQVELRILAHVSGEPKLREAFAAGEDIHAATAAEVLGKERSELTKDERNVAKMVNFGIIYGISAFGLSENLDIPREEAQTYIDTYLARFPHVQDFIQRTIEQAERDGYATTLFGRRRPVPGAEGAEPPDPRVRRAARRQLRHAGHGRGRDQGGDGLHPPAAARGGPRRAARPPGARRAPARGAGGGDLGRARPRPRGDVRRLPARPAAGGRHRRRRRLERSEVVIPRELRTERLLLRQWREEDAEALGDLRAAGVPRAHAAARPAHASAFAREWERDGFSLWAARTREFSGGSACATRLAGSGARRGRPLHRDWWGRPATRAAPECWRSTSTTRTHLDHAAVLRAVMDPG